MRYLLLIMFVSGCVCLPSSPILLLEFRDSSDKNSISNSNGGSTNGGPTNGGSINGGSTNGGTVDSGRENNGFGNGDQNAPGRSGSRNNAENDPGGRSDPRGGKK